jgi:hypothetical protein
MHPDKGGNAAKWTPITAAYNALKVDGGGYGLFDRHSALVSERFHKRVQALRSSAAASCKTARS